MKTKRQKEYLDYMDFFVSVHKRYPTYQEIGTHFEVTGQAVRGCIKRSGRAKLASRSERAITEKQNSILTFIKQYIADNRVSPTYREIQKEFGMKYIGAVETHLCLMAKKKLLKTNSWARGIELL